MCKCIECFKDIRSGNLCVSCFIDCTKNCVASFNFQDIEVYESHYKVIVKRDLGYRESLKWSHCDHEEYTVYSIKYNELKKRLKPIIEEILKMLSPKTVEESLNNIVLEIKKGNEDILPEIIEELNRED